jgi:hypothetical protein
MPRFVAAGGVFTVIELDVAAVSVPDVKLKVCAPEPAMLRLLNVATPLEFVVAVSVPPSVPDPLALLTVTVTPDVLTLLPPASFRRTAALNVAPLLTDVGGCVDIANCDAVAATVIVDDVAWVTPLAVNFSVCAPEPVIDRPLNVATPVLLVATVAVPFSVPVPDAIATVTFTPDWVTLFPDTSRSRTTGCVAKLVPDVTLVEGCVVMTS